MTEVPEQAGGNVVEMRLNQ